MDGQRGYPSTGTRGSVRRVLTEKRWTSLTSPHESAWQQLILGVPRAPLRCVRAERNALCHHRTRRLDYRHRPSNAEGCRNHSHGAGRIALLAITRDGKRGYTSNVRVGTVSAIDLVGRKVIAVIPVSKRHSVSRFRRMTRWRSQPIRSRLGWP